MPSIASTHPILWGSTGRRTDHQAHGAYHLIQYRALHQTSASVRGQTTVSAATSGIRRLPTDACKSDFGIAAIGNIVDPALDQGGTGRRIKQVIPLKISGRR